VRKGKSTSPRGDHHPKKKLTEDVATEELPGTDGTPQSPPGGDSPDTPGKVSPAFGQGSSEADTEAATATPAAEADMQSVSEEDVTVSLDQHQRLLAEFDNFRKRIERERARTALYARSDLVRHLLPVLDDMERAKNALGPEDRAFDREGMLIIMDRFAALLRKEGLAEVAASPGEPFDPEFHEAVLTIPTADFAEGCVSEVLEKGYQLGDRLLRPAKVVVARAPDEQPNVKSGDD
jgi:molecular chaperone GrpE